MRNSKPAPVAWCLVALLTLVGCGGGGIASSGSSSPSPAATSNWLVTSFGMENGMPATMGDTWSVAAASTGDGGGVVAGSFYDRTGFGWGTDAETILEGVDQTDTFIASIGCDGTLRWAQVIDGLDYTEVQGVAAGPDGSIYACGYLYGPTTFAGGTPEETSLLVDGGDDGYLASYASDGTLQWVKPFSSSGYDEVLDVCVRGDGAVVVTGVFDGPLVLGAGEPGETTLEPTSDTEAFVACYAPDGMLLWARGTASTGYAGGWGVDVLPDDAVAVVGDFQGSTSFAVGAAGETMLASTDGSVDVFVARFDAAGALEWVRAMGGADRDYSAAVCAGEDGRIGVTGIFQGSAVFDAGETVRTAQADYDGFLAVLDPAGGLQWVRTLAGSGFEQLNDAAIRSDGSVVTMGTFHGVADVEREDGGAVDVAATGESQDILAIAYDADGALQDACAFGGLGDDSAACLVRCHTKVVVVGGYMQELSLGAGGVRPGTADRWCAFACRMDPADLR